MQWAYGVTTFHTRVQNGLLKRTLGSLSQAGFDEPWLFIDGALPAGLPSYLDKYEMVHRVPAIRIYGNFALGLYELYIRDPNAERYAMFQDDFVTCKNLRKYLEHCRYPDKGYWNLYTFPQNTKQFEGWYLSNQLGKGAVALVFDRETVLQLLGSRHWLERPQNPEKGWKAIDGGVVTALKKAGIKEYVHGPSLVQHIGETSTLGNRRHDLAPNFPGEAFDALEFLPKPPKRAPTTKQNRIGLVGYSCHSGLGEVNRQIAKYADIHYWLIKPHPQFRTVQPEDVDWTVCPVGAKLDEFLKMVDTVLFCEVPLYDRLVEACRARNKRIVCVPMVEWMPPGAKGWPQNVDLFLCPTKHCYDSFAHLVPCLHFPWPVDTQRFNPREITRCERFVFINGHGGWRGRKGAGVLREALRIWPDMPVTIYDQAVNEWPTGLVAPSPENNADLYKSGDVLISPHSVDGIGLEVMEAMSAGMPVISTNGMPWNELPALARIPAKLTTKTVRRPVEWYIPDPRILVDLCKTWLHQDISQASQAARDWATSNCWNDETVAKFNDLVRTGKGPPRTVVPQKPKPTKPTGRPERWDKFLFDEALAEFEAIGGNIIVEIGSIRDGRPVAKHSDGWSTVRWAETGKRVHCIDLDPKAIAVTKAVVNGKGNVSYYCRDAIQFLRDFKGQIDLLYLDGPDADKGGQELHLAMFLDAPLAQKAIVLIDDCDLMPGRWQGRGKGERVLAEAQRRGFKLVLDNGRQVLLVRA